MVRHDHGESWSLARASFRATDGLDLNLLGWVRETGSRTERLFCLAALSYMLDDLVGGRKTLAGVAYACCIPRLLPSWFPIIAKHAKELLYCEA